MNASSALDLAVGIGLVWFFIQAWLNRKPSRGISASFSSADIASAVRRRKHTGDHDPL